MEKCLGFGKSKKVMIRLKMGYEFYLEVEITFPLFRGASQSYLWFRSLQIMSAGFKM
jgi:hypothetical protein